MDAVESETCRNRQGLGEILVRYSTKKKSFYMLVLFSHEGALCDKALT